MSDIKTHVDLLRAWRERAETLAQSGRREASEERARAADELEGYIRTLSALLLPPRDTREGT